MWLVSSPTSRWKKQFPSAWTPCTETNLSKDYTHSRSKITAAQAAVKGNHWGEIYLQWCDVSPGGRCGHGIARPAEDWCWPIFLLASTSRISRKEMTRLYHRSVDDMLSIAVSKKACGEFFDQLNSLHPALKFTMEMEANRKLPLLDIWNWMTGFKYWSRAKCF